MCLENPSPRRRGHWKWCSNRTSGLVWSLDNTLSVFCLSLWTLLAGDGFRAGTKPHRCFWHYQTGHTHAEQKHTLAVSTLRTAQCLFLISAGWSAVHTMPLIPVPVHLSCRCFLSVWAKTFYLNLLRVPLKGLCYCSEPSCVCVCFFSKEIRL